VTSGEGTDQGPNRPGHEATARGQAFEPSCGSRRELDPRVASGLVTRVSSVSLSVLPSAGADPPSVGELSGGDEETRTPDPLLAKEMLCQLSYVPAGQAVVEEGMVGVSGLEPETSALSGQCSNQLS
jgi:hypothetical protein